MEVGDKEQLFVGSQSWIGAVELGFALDHLLGVTGRIVHVRSGLDIPAHAAELAEHFRVHGSPVMGEATLPTRPTRCIADHLADAARPAEVALPRLLCTAARSGWRGAGVHDPRSGARSGERGLRFAGGGPSLHGA